jgi:hypothetical protein
MKATTVLPEGKYMFESTYKTDEVDLQIVDQGSDEEEEIEAVRKELHSFKKSETFNGRAHIFSTQLFAYSKVEDG